MSSGFCVSDSSLQLNQKNWGKEMDVSPILTLNTGDDDNSFLGNYTYRDGRLKRC